MPQRRSALGWLKQVSSETTELFDRMAQTSERATDRSSEVLFGVVGGASALVAAYALCLTVPAATFVLAGPIAAVFGIPAGILSWRGRRRFKLEKRIAENRIATDELLDRIKSLPKSAPQSVRDGLWMQYIALSADISTQNYTALATPMVPPHQSHPALAPPDGNARDDPTPHR